MDFWNRLIGSSGPPNPVVSRSHPLPTPEQRLARFKRTWQTLLHSWRNARNNDSTSQEMLRSHIKRLTDTLIEEEKCSARLCVNFCYEQQVFIALSKIGQTESAGVVRECISAFSTLIENEDEDFLGHESFARNLIAFLAATSQRAVPSFEAESVELLFSIAAKIRLSPSILKVWFTRGDGRGERDHPALKPQQRFAGITNKEDFPLFYLLIDYVHHEGRVGDFARTGLLYIVEAASSSTELEEWIVESDLATLMASGLGALYSQLSRKLMVTFPADELPPILLLSDFSTSPPTFGAVPSTSPELQTHLETFLSYLIFWQDVLEHCKSQEVKQTLLDHFQILFLQQLLYPSLLESSDVDGGSSVAVLTYVRVILDTLEHPDMIHLILSYLMNLSEASGPLVSPTRQSRNRRRSLDLLTQVSKAMDNPSPSIYSLVDLIMTSLGSKSSQTVSATLRLTSTILRKHYPYTMNTLLKTVPITLTAPLRTMSAHQHELNTLFSFFTSLSNDSPSSSYDDHIKDCSYLMESHPFTATYLDLRNPSGASGPRFLASQLQPHTLHPHDPFLKKILDLLATFFGNTVETNLVLTCVIVDMVACAYMRPEGWLFYDPRTYADTTSEFDLESDGYDSGDVSGSRAKLLSSPLPPAMDAIKKLVEKFKEYRTLIPNLDKHLKDRRRGFEVSEEIGEALRSTPSPLSSRASRRIVSAPYHSFDPFSPKDLTRPSTASSIESPHRRPTPTPRGLNPGIHYPPPPESGPRVDGERDDGDTEKNLGFSISHLVTNTCILLEFIMELAAMIQVRTAMLGDITAG